MPGFGDSAFIVLLALLLFGPKKLPVLARQFGKLMADFRRASNEFRTQMEEELRLSEQADRQKQVAAIEASAPVNVIAPPVGDLEAVSIEEAGSTYEHEPLPTSTTAEPIDPPASPLPIATSGELSIQPPSTGLPIPSSNGPAPAHIPELETETLHG